MSMAYFLTILLGGFCLAALLLGLYRPTWVLPVRRATRLQVLLLYSFAGLLGPLVISELVQRVAHAQSASPVGGEVASSVSTGDAGGHSLRINEAAPEPESLRELAQRMLLDLGLGAGHRLRVGRLSLVYEDPVSEAQALALGEFLSHSEVGDRGSGGSHQVQVQLRKSTTPASPATPEAFEVRIATQFLHRQELDPETKAAYQMVGLVASGIAFDGAPVHIHVCTAALRPLLVLRPQLAASASANEP